MNPPVTNISPNPGEQVIARASKERRRFRRVRVSLAGRLYIPATQEEAICTVEDISAGDATLICELKSEPQGRAVIYLDGLGRFEGPVVRSREGGFVITFSCSMQKREKLVDQLTLELNRHLLDESDLSLTGLSIRSDMKPPVGEHILIGNRAGRVARHHSDGIGVEFLGSLQESQNLLEMPSELATLSPPAHGSNPVRKVASAGARL